MGKLIKRGLPIAAIVAAVVFFASDRNAMLDTERSMSGIVTEIAQRSVTVDCQGLVAEAVDVSGHDGTVEFDAAGNPADSTELKRKVCKTLASFPSDRLKPEFACVHQVGTCSEPVIDSVKAVHTLAHEAWHLRGIKDERITTCYAMQTTAWTALQLGVDGAAVGRGRAAGAWHRRVLRPRTLPQAVAKLPGRRLPRRGPLRPQPRLGRLAIVAWRKSSRFSPTNPHIATSREHSRQVTLNVPVLICTDQVNSNIAYPVIKCITHASILPSTQ